jgi:putative multicomponent Na+:H+ antiporter subunit B
MDNYVYIIVALLPLAALTSVLQANPYQALVVRAILGAIAALVYAVLGAADVALTEALVGTMLAITLYVVAVRSSLVMRLGVLPTEAETNDSLQELIAQIRKVIHQYHLRLEIVEYPHLEALKGALQEKQIHATCTTRKPEEDLSQNQTAVADPEPTYHTAIRVPRLYEIMEKELVFPDTTVTYVATVNEGEKH